jgi:hypothetical protein
MLDTNSVASELYTAYCNGVGWKSFNGNALPSWENLVLDESKSKIVAAWLAAAQRAIDLFTE